MVGDFTYPKTHHVQIGYGRMGGAAMRDWPVEICLKPYQTWPAAIPDFGVS